MEFKKDVKDEELSRLLDFLRKESDQISIERYCDEKIPEEEFLKAKNHFIQYVENEDKKRRERYVKDNRYKKLLKKRMGIDTDSSAKAYFDDLLKQDMEVAENVSNDGEERETHDIKQDVISKKYTMVTATTQGPLMQMYVLKIGDVFENIKNQMKGLFDFPYTINGEDYENLAFYKQGVPIFCICSHEEYAIELLTEEQRNALKKTLNRVSEKGEI